jgi:hypothetical protein
MNPLAAPPHGASPNYISLSRPVSILNRQKKTAPAQQARFH